MVRRVQIVAFVLALVAGFTLQQVTQAPLEAQQTGGLGFFDSAARTSTTTGERVTFTQARGLLLNLNVTAASGTTPTLDVKIQWQDPVTSVWNDLSGAAFQRITATGTRTLTIYPGQEGPGLLRIITGTDPAAGVEITETVPADKRWLLESFNASFTTDATVASRAPVLIIDDGTVLGATQRVPVAATIAASGSANIVGAQYGFSGTVLGYAVIPLSQPLYIPGGGRIRTGTGSLQAGDNYTAPILAVHEYSGNYAGTPVPRFLRAVATIAGTTPSFTFTVAGAVIP